jgi:hypothetical protein
MLLLVLLVGWASSHAAAQEMPIPPPPPAWSQPAPFPTAVISSLPVAPEQPKAPNTRVNPHDEGNLAQTQYLKREEDQGYNLSSEIPGPDRLFRPRLSESQFEELQRQDAKRFGLTKRVIFPERGPLTQEKFEPRQWEPSVTEVTPGYVLHDRLYFDQPNFERYGWELGVLGPPVQLGTFGLDLALLPYRMFSRPFDQIDGSAGKYLPGDNVPLMLYPESFSLTGLAGMAGSYAAVPFIFK